MVLRKYKVSYITILNIHLCFSWKQKLLLSLSLLFFFSFLICLCNTKALITPIKFIYAHHADILNPSPSWKVLWVSEDRLIAWTAIKILTINLAAFLSRAYTKSQALQSFPG